MKIISVVGARPNFMKIGPIHRALHKADGIDSLIVHTGQHYDKKMSDIFFNQLELPVPDYFLGVGGGSHTQQTSGIMLEFEKVLLEEKPTLVLVVGDVNSTIACALVAVKMHIPVVHVEAGLRSGDMEMPEEINRVLTDRISELLFVTEQSGLDNLDKEGVEESRVKFVGNVMIDSLVNFKEKAGQVDMAELFGDNIPEKGQYVLMTMHRPKNVDHEASLRQILKIIKETTARLPVVFPVHPRTQKNMEKFGLLDELKSIDNLQLLGPLGYLHFLNLMANARAIITDSGGIQEETTFLQVPCITFRDSTERPITVTLGTNYLMSDIG